MSARDLPPRLAGKILRDDRGCWIWTGARQSRGYGSAAIPGTNRTTLAHRAIYELLVGTIPAGLTLDHLCRVKVCVNPDHLEPVSRAENVRRGPGAMSKRTHCPQGHPYSGSNLYVHPRGSRECRTCRAMRKARSLVGAA